MARHPPAGPIRSRAPARNPEPEHCRSDVDPLSDQQLTRPGEPLVVEEGAVLAPQVFEEQVLPAPGQPGMPPADGGVRQPKIAAARASKDERALAHREQLAGSRTMLRVEEDLLVPNPGQRSNH